MEQNNLHNPVASENEQKFHFCINFNTVDSKQINECSKIVSQKFTYFVRWFRVGEIQLFSKFNRPPTPASQEMYVSDRGWSLALKMNYQ